MVGRRGTGALTKEAQEAIVALFKSPNWPGATQVGMQYRISRNAVLGIIHRARGRGELPQVDGRPGPRSKMQLNRQRLVSRATTGFQAKSKPLPKIKVSKNEPEVLGPANDFPPHGTCQYTKDDVSKPGWRMCGHPGFPWCEWHLEHRIKPRAA